MTKYVLNSGGIKSHPEAAKKYFAELLGGLGTKPKILWCFFATFPDDTEKRFSKYTNLHATHFPEGTTPVHKNATTENFSDEVTWADVIYMHGGLVRPLKDILEKYNLDELFAEKCVGTTSASSMALAQYSWSGEQRKVVDGLGLFQLKFIAHFDSDFWADDPRGPINWDAAYEELKNYGDTSLPIYALREGEFIVRERYHAS